MKVVHLVLNKATILPASVLQIDRENGANKNVAAPVSQIHVGTGAHAKRTNKPEVIFVCVDQASLETFVKLRPTRVNQILASTEGNVLAAWVPAQLSPSANARSITTVDIVKNQRLALDRALT